MHLFNTRRRKVLATFMTCLIAGLGAVALAAWLTDGTGEGTTKVGNLSAPTVSPDGSGSGFTGCLPGGDCAGKFSVKNDNNVDLVVTGIDPAVGSADTGTTNQPACPYTEITTNSKTGLVNQGYTAPANSTTTITVPGAYKLAADAPSVCQGALLTRGATLHFTTP